MTLYLCLGTFHPQVTDWTHVHLFLFIHLSLTLHILKLHQRSAVCQVSQNQWHWHPFLCLGNTFLFKATDMQQVSYRWPAKVQAPPSHTWLASDHRTHNGKFWDGLERRPSLHSSPSKHGAHLKDDRVLAVFSAGHLLDSLGELPASLANIPGSVADTLDWAGKALFLLKDGVRPPTSTVVGDATAWRNS